MSRAKWKGPYLKKSLIKVVYKKKKEIATTPRNIVIIPFFVGKTFFIYNGKTFIKIKITHDMVGHKFGEFSPTRKQFTYKKKKNRK